MVAEVERELGPIDALVSNAGINLREDAAWDADPDAWWRVFEVNVLGAYLCARAVIPGMLERGRGRIVNTGSGASYLPGLRTTAYPSSKAALGRFAETLANQLADTPVRVFVISPGLVRTDMTGADFPDDAPWTPPELAPRARARAALRPGGCAGRPVPPRRARRHRRPDRPGGRDPRRRPERDPAQALGGARLDPDGAADGEQVGPPRRAARCRLPGGGPRRLAASR